MIFSINLQSIQMWEDNERETERHSGSFAVIWSEMNVMLWPMSMFQLSIEHWLMRAEPFLCGEQIWSSSMPLTEWVLPGFSFYALFNISMWVQDD